MEYVLETCFSVASLGADCGPPAVLYSSGTTGKPKAIVHSVGGMTLSQKMVQCVTSTLFPCLLRADKRKRRTLHNATVPGDSQLTFTTLGWMMWNHLLSTLGCGACIAAYDGSPFAPSASTIWAITARYKLTNLGLSPRYLQVLETEGYIPNKEFDLTHVKQVQTAGSVLKPELYDCASRFLRCLAPYFLNAVADQIRADRDARKHPRECLGQQRHGGHGRASSPFGLPNSPSSRPSS